MAAAKNHVRALVHSTGSTMTWALNYYKAYKFELSQKSTDDMILDDVIDLAAKTKIVTFTDVLQAMLDASNAGFSEIMIVAHGSPKGLTMHLGPGIGSADKERLPLLTALAPIVAELDRIRAITDSTQQLAEWIKLLRSVAGKAIANAFWGPIASDEFDGITSIAAAERLLFRISPTLGPPALQIPAVLHLLRLRNQVVAKKFKRVEVRACNLGQDPDGMKALREFLGVAVVVAPMVKTFYAHVAPEIFVKEADYKKRLAARVPWRLKSKSDPLHSRTYIGADLYLTMKDADPTPLSVLQLLQPGFQACWGLGTKTKSYAMIQLLVEKNIDVKKNSGYRSGSFYVGGLDPEAGRTPTNPPPTGANGKAYLLSSEPEYRQMIVSNP